MWAEGDCRRNCTLALKSSISPYLTAPWRLPELPPLSRAASHILSTSLLPNQRSSLQNKALATCQVLFAINIFLTDMFLQRQHTHVFAHNLVLSGLARLLLHRCIHFINGLVFLTLDTFVNVALHRGEVNLCQPPLQTFVLREEEEEEE